MPQRVVTTDDNLQLHEERDLNSAAINLKKGVELQLDAATVFEGREWMEATFKDGVGYVLGPAARGHTTLMGDTTPAEVVLPQPSRSSARASDGLFSEGFFGLLNKGPIGWIIFGLAAGLLYGAYQSLQNWAK